MEEKKASRSGNKYYEVILDWFRQQILSGQMKEGDPIPSERELASQFGVSRVPVREALRILEYIGIINNGPDGMTIQRVDVQLFTPGANFATEITQETIENLFEVRIFLESAAAYYAALRHTDEDIVQIREAIQAMYDYDWSVFNANRSYQNHTQEIAAPSFEQSEESYSPLMNKYQEAISVTDHYCETNSRFAWVGKIEDEQLLSALERLSELDLKILTLYVYVGYTESEIAGELGGSKVAIHKRIEKITKFLKNF